MIKVGDELPTGYTFRFIELDEIDEKQCKIPITLKLTKQFLQDKKIVIVSVPAAFSPVCSDVHVPEILKKLNQFKNKGVDLVMIISNNDAFVLYNWGKQLTQNMQVDKDFKLLFASDSNTEFSKKLGLTQDSSKFGMGTRTARYGLVVNKGVVEYVGVETKPGVSVSGAKTLLSKL